MAIVSLASCTTAIDERNKEETRIKVKESVSVEGAAFFILEIDGTEYLANYRGGIVKLEK